MTSGMCVHVANGNKVPAQNTKSSICMGQHWLPHPEKLELFIASSEGMQAELVWWPACQGGLPESLEAPDPPLSKPATVHHSSVMPTCPGSAFFTVCNTQ